MKKEKVIELLNERLSCQKNMKHLEYLNETMEAYLNQDEKYLISNGYIEEGDDIELIDFFYDILDIEYRIDRINNLEVYVSL